MQARERIIRERFAEQVCAHCGTRYPASGIVVLARRPAAWMILASCEHCQHHSIFVVRFSLPHAAAPEDSLPEATNLLPDALLPPAASSGASSGPQSPTSLDRHDEAIGAPHDEAMDQQPITDRDVDAMHEFLSSFDGDFQSLFAHQRPRAKDDSSSS